MCTVEFTLEMNHTVAQAHRSNTPENALSTLLYMLHHYALGNSRAFDQALGMRIFQHLEAISGRDDIAEPLRHACDELSDAWLLAAKRQQRP